MGSNLTSSKVALIATEVQAIITYLGGTLLADWSAKAFLEVLNAFGGQIAGGLN